MKKVDYLISLLTNYKGILVLANTKEDLTVIDELCKELENYKEQKISVLLDKLREVGTQKRSKTKSNSFNSEEIVRIYKKDDCRVCLSDDESLVLKEFEVKFPGFKDILHDSLVNLYEKIGEDSKNDISIEEMQILLLYHFEVKATGTKKELISELRKNIYQSNHFDDLKKNYSKER